MFSSCSISVPGSEKRSSAEHSAQSLANRSLLIDGDGGFHNPLEDEDDDDAAVAARGAAAGAGEGGDGAPAAPESV